MNNEIQLDRYKRLISFINTHFKEDISIPDIERSCNYSYRNINRIFEAINNETIGKYIKRIRLDKGAEYLKYSDRSISDIAFDIGYSDVAAFSKAFKNRFQCSPSSFRENEHISNSSRLVSSLDTLGGTLRSQLHFDVEVLPEFEVLGIEYKGSYQDTSALENKWDQLLKYAEAKGIINEDTIYLTEILDDDGITEQINCRITMAITIEKAIDFELEGLIFAKNIDGGKYVKFVHKGSHETCEDTYHQIYSHWLHLIPHEMRDAPTLEFYLNDIENTPVEELITELYIPIM